MIEKILKNILDDNGKTKIDINEIARNFDGKTDLLGDLVDWEIGDNSNGSYFKHPSGLLVCWIEDLEISTYVNEGTLKTTWTLPTSYLSDNGQPGGRPAIFITKNEYNDSVVLRRSSNGGVVKRDGNYAEVFLMVDTGMKSHWVQNVRAMTIGRWK